MNANCGENSSRSVIKNRIEKLVRAGYLSNGTERLGSRINGCNLFPPAQQTLKFPPSGPGSLAFRDLPLYAIDQNHKFFRLMISLGLLAHLLEILGSVANTICHGG